MIGDQLGEAADGVFGAVDDAVGEDLAKADELLAGKERSPTDINKLEAEFIRGVDLATPDGDIPSAAAAPNDVGGSGSAASTLSMGRRIEFIHFGHVHRDWARNFHHDESIDDTADIDLSGVIGSRAIAFRAALEREALLLAGIARAAQAALEEKGEKEGATADLLTAAADLLGGATGTAQDAVAADLTPFLDKVKDEAWSLINKGEIKYPALHEAGIKLHEVRANLVGYLREQLEAQKNPPKEAKGLLSDLPFVGEIPLPPVLGDIIGFMQKVTGKLYDVQTALIFELVLAMRLPIEKACLQASLAQLTKRTAPIYPTWYTVPEEEAGEEDQPFADVQMNSPLGGDLDRIDPLHDINEGFQNGIADTNQAINDGVAPAMDVIDFLSKDVEPAPGNQYIDDVFGAQKVPDGPWFGSDALGKLAVGCFGRAMGSGEIPGFMEGFVSDILKNVFGVAAEFLRAVYQKLCGLGPTETIAVEELVKAGRDNLVFQLVDLALEKTGLDKLLEKLEFQIPKPPFPLPTGIHWPTDTLTTDPIIAMLKSKLSEGLAPVLDPAIEYAMAGLAERLNDQRSWARGRAMTMEVHLAQLPSELALMFRNLFGPLWEFITDTLMGAINDVMSEVLGPAASVVGVAKDGVGAVTGAIADAKKKADQAVAYAKNVEDKVGKLLDELSSISVSLDNADDLADIMGAADDLANAVGADPFAEEGGGGSSGGPPMLHLPFPANRLWLGKGKRIEPADLEAVEPKWDEAKTSFDETDAETEQQEATS